MKYTFYVFSGSGNTDKVCREIRGKLEKSGAETEYWRFRKGEKYPDAVRTDAVVIGYPVHAFNAPTPVTEFVKEIPEGKGRKAYLVATSGEPLTLNDFAFVKTGKILEEKGWILSGTYRYVMPYNIIFRHSEGMAARMWLAARKNIERDVKKIIEGKDGDVTDMSFSAYSAEDGQIIFDNVGWYLSLERFDGTLTGAQRALYPLRDLLNGKIRPDMFLDALRVLRADEESKNTAGIRENLLYHKDISYISAENTGKEACEKEEMP